MALLRCGATICQAFVVSRPNFYFRLIVNPPLHVPRDGARGEDPQLITRLMQAYADGIAAPGPFIALLLIPLSIGIAVLRYHLFDIDILINRTLLYGALTVSVVGIYVLVVGYLSVLFRTAGGQGHLAISVLANLCRNRRELSLR